MEFGAHRSATGNPSPLPFPSAPSHVAPSRLTRLAIYDSRPLVLHDDSHFSKETKAGEHSAMESSSNSNQDVTSAPPTDQSNGTRPEEGGGRFRRSTSSTQTRNGLGRSGPRSRSGCVTCKQRRVRCDEVHPTCGHCTRLQLVCEYKPPKFGQRWRRQSETHSQEQRDVSVSSPPPTVPGQSYVHAPVDGLDTHPASSHNSRQRDSYHLADTPSAVFAGFSRSGYATPTQSNGFQPYGQQSRRFDFNDIFSDINTSWAGETLMILPDHSGAPDSFLFGSMSEIDNQFGSLPSLMDVDDSPSQLHNGLLDQYTQPKPAMHRRDTMETSASSAALNGSTSAESRISLTHDSARLMQLFRNIVQPPAAILIGGTERWRRLQHYLCKLSDHSRAVRSALLCVSELLIMDDGGARNDTQTQAMDKEASMKRILDRHAAACEEIQSKISKHAHLKPKTREQLLAAIFLLSWFEVIRDQDTHSSSLFPSHLADVVITSDTTWSRYSQQLLSWLNTLDSKASHLGGKHLLSSKSLEVVSHFTTQITSALDHSGTTKDHAEDSEFAVSDMSPGNDSHHSPENTFTTQSPTLSMGQVKQVMLNTILQPALEWYLTSQSFCRRISAFDKHHRRRFTSDDEYEVITACKELEHALFELWDYRPAIISVPAEQLGAIVSPDMAKRLEEVFSVYIASFWILFVYLHRVSWWNLPHSSLTIRALGEVWRHMQRAYGEEVNGPLRKVIHPSLLWPLFMFGSESPDTEKRNWAVEQLEALGEAKPATMDEGVEGKDRESLPPFRLSSGATRNAKRAAALLRELIKEQDARGARVDDRDLSMRLFNCYFSIV